MGLDLCYFRKTHAGSTSAMSEREWTRLSSNNKSTKSCEHRHLNNHNRHNTIIKYKLKFII